MSSCEDPIETMFEIPIPFVSSVERMDSEIKAEWISRLRSGEYVQGQKSLAWSGIGRDMEYCCLGVLCEIASKRGITTKSSVRSDFNIEILYFDNESHYLPDAVTEWAKVERHGAVMTALGERSWDTLASANDEGLTFDQIADLIEYFL